MKSRLLFRQSGAIVRTASRWPELIWPIVGVLSMLALIASGAWLDMDRDLFAGQQQHQLQQQAQHEADVQEAFEAGRRRGRTEMVDSARSIWQAALDAGQQQCAAVRGQAVRP
jgi:hypothetical protein